MQLTNKSVLYLNELMKLTSRWKTNTCIVAEGQVTKNIEGDNQVKKYTPSVNLNLIMTYMANKPSHLQQVSIVQ